MEHDRSGVVIRTIMENDCVSNRAKELEEIARLREDNEALRGSAMLWRRLYEGMAMRQFQPEIEPEPPDLPEPS